MYPVNVRKAKGKLATTVRYIGADSPEAHAAHLEFAALRSVHDLATEAAEHGTFTPAQVAAVVAAMTDEEAAR